MSAPRLIRPCVAAAGLLAPCWAALAGDNPAIWTDIKGDTAVRRTSTGQPSPNARLPDLLAVRIYGWQSPTPFTNPYNGSPTPNPGDAHLLRIDIEFAGLVNPPGRLGDGITTEYRPFLYGDSPVYGFLEIDVDDDRDTGGELGPAAKSKYLANIGRFGRVPQAPLNTRTARWGDEIDANFYSTPQFERSGADWVLTLCGCFEPEVVCQQNGNTNQIFEADEAWIVRGRFFQRAGGYQDASYTYNGSAPGLYDPPVNLRFSHSSAVNKTTITLVYALDMEGARQLANAPSAPPINYDVSDYTSVKEGLSDLIDAANSMTLSGPVYVLAHRWQGRHAGNYLDPTRWRVTALFGTAFDTLQDSPYVWTDTGFQEKAGDLIGDGTATFADAQAVRDTIRMYDGTFRDLDPPWLENHSITIVGFGHNFSVYDVNGDGIINDQDARWYCIADFNQDGYLNIFDYNAFMTGFIARDPRADIDGNGSYDINDYIGFGAIFAAGCP